MSDFNQQVIEEFRANEGQVAGTFAGIPLLLLITAGARTAAPRTTPVAYLRDGDRVLIFASNAGGDRHPAWFHNLVANPHVTIEIGEGAVIRTYAARAVPIDGDERDRWYTRQAQRNPAFAEYQANTQRTIPVVALHPLVLDADRVGAIGLQLTRHHATLRDELARLRKELDGRSVPALRSDLLGHCLTFCDHLDLHHIRENGSFTAFEARFPGLAPALARLRDEHRTVAKALGDLRQLVGSDAEIAHIASGVDRIASELEEHFAYEEAVLLRASS